ncbi:MAG TPA: Eco57I restriction-modification methylase domain-containing protein [Candidatus Elarobacter sp.]
MARERAEALDDTDRLALARTFGYHVVVAWWNAFAGDSTMAGLRELFEPVRPIRMSRAMTVLAEKIGRSLAALDAESAAYHVGLTYIGMLSRAHRAAHGIYYTPPLLGARLLDQATIAGVDWATARVLDPACGGGAFLAPVARRIVDTLGACEPRILLQNVAQRLRGYEIDPFAAWLSQVTLDAVLLPVARECGRRLPNVVTVCDSLLSRPSHELFDLVIGNPPYKRVRLDTIERRRFERSLFGHANLYGLFTDVAIRQTKPGGVIAYVTPTSFLAGEYYKKLRALLEREAPPFSIDFLAAREGVFDEVLQETLLATYRRGAARDRVRIHEIAPIDEMNLFVESAGDAPLPSDPSHPWTLPRNRDQVALAATLTSMSHRLADWGYTVSTGPLVWNRYKPQLMQRVARNRYPIVWAEAVTTEGQFVWRADKRNHVPYCEIRPGDEWMTVKKPCVLLQRTTAKEQYRRLIAAPLPADFIKRHEAVVVENHLNMIRPVVPKPAVSSSVLASFLNSGAADRAFRCVSGSVAVSAYELESMPLPAPDELAALSRLVASGADRRTIDVECERLYADTCLS